jgi:hypothetical protein
MSFVCQVSQHKNELQRPLRRAEYIRTRGLIYEPHSRSLFNKQVASSLRLVARSLTRLGSSSRGQLHLQRIHLFVWPIRPLTSKSTSHAGRHREEDRFFVSSPGEKVVVGSARSWCQLQTAGTGYYRLRISHKQHFAQRIISWGLMLPLRLASLATTTTHSIIIRPRADGDVLLLSHQNIFTWCSAFN